MITDFLFYILFATLSVILTPIKALSDVSLPSGFTTAITSIGGYTSAMNSILPIDTLITIIALILGIEAIIVAYKLIMWVIKKIPFIGG